MLASNTRWSPACRHPLCLHLPPCCMQTLVGITCCPCAFAGTFSTPSRISRLACSQPSTLGPLRMCSLGHCWAKDPLGECIAASGRALLWPSRSTWGVLPGQCVGQY